MVSPPFLRYFTTQKMEVQERPGQRVSGPGKGKGAKTTEELRKELQKQGLLLELIIEILAMYFEEDGLSLISSQQLHCPSSERNEKVRMLVQQIRELS